MDNTEYKKFATETMIEVSKLLITLASGFFVISTTLIKILSGSADDPIRSFWALVLTWVCLFVSITGGVIALGDISTSAHDRNEFNVDAPATCWSFRIQQVAFLFAFVSVSYFAVANK